MNEKSLNVPRQLKVKASGELLGLQRDLAAMSGLSQFKVFHEVLPAGHRSSRVHYHTMKEELVFVLQGRPSIYYGSEKISLQPGEHFGIPCGEGISHVVINETTAPVEMLIIFCEIEGC